jgi:hypothetical protein
MMCDLIHYTHLVSNVCNISVVQVVETVDKGGGSAIEGNQTRLVAGNIAVAA